MDLAWVSRFLGLAAVVLSRGERWHALVEAGRQWARLSEGAFNERIMPWLLQVGAERDWRKGRNGVPEGEGKRRKWGAHSEKGNTTFRAAA